MVEWWSCIDQLQETCGHCNADNQCLVLSNGAVQELLGGDGQSPGLATIRNELKYFGGNQSAAWFLCLAAAIAKSSRKYREAVADYERENDEQRRIIEELTRERSKLQRKASDNFLESDASRQLSSGGHTIESLAKLVEGEGVQLRVENAVLKERSENLKARLEQLERENAILREQVERERATHQSRSPPAISRTGGASQEGGSEEAASS